MSRNATTSDATREQAVTARIGIAGGAAYLLKGFASLRHPRLLPFVLLPLLANIAIYYWAITTLWQGFDAWIGNWMQNLPDWLAFLRNVLNLVFYLGATLLVAITFTWLANLVGSPFYGLMAEQLQALHSDEKGAEWQPGVAALLRLIGRALLREIQKLLYYLSRAALLAILSALGLLAAPLAALMPVLWFVFSAKMMTLQYTDYAYDNNGVAFKAMRGDLKRRRSGGMGFGAITALASMVPLLNAIVVPAAVCGGTLLYLDSRDSNN